MVALDVPGGDFAPHATLVGALKAARAGIPILLCGSTSAISHQLSELDIHWQTLPLLIREAPEVIAMAEHPALAVRHKPRSSLMVALDAVRSGECGGIVSAGNSGALMVGAVRLLGLVDGIASGNRRIFADPKWPSALCRPGRKRRLQAPVFGSIC